MRVPAAPVIPTLLETLAPRASTGLLRLPPPILPAATVAATTEPPDADAVLRAQLASAVLERLGPVPPALRILAADAAQLPLSRRPAQIDNDGVLQLQLRLPLIVDRAPPRIAQLQLALLPGLPQLAPQLVADWAASALDLHAALPPLQLPAWLAAELPGFALSLTPAAQWPLLQLIALGQWRLLPQDADDEGPEAEDPDAPPQMLSTALADWLALHEARRARR